MREKKREDEEDGSLLGPSPMGVFQLIDTVYPGEVDPTESHSNETAADLT